ncbi:MAG: COX15/CtaA family protein [Acidimicrobiales bacterium]
MTLVAMSIIIITGGAVRLTQSGLGCPTWPNCTAHHLAASFSFHPMVEFVNRLITIFCSGIIILIALAAFVRKPFRRDLAKLAFGLIGGLIAEIVLGGITVLEKLAPPFVMAHFMLALIVAWNALVLYRRASTPEPIRHRRVTIESVWVVRILLANLAAVIFMGTVVTGTGPHSGSPISKRLPFQLRAVAELHADLVLFLIGLTLATVFLLHQGRAPADVQRTARFLLVAEAAQAAIGYTQYFTNLPALLVGFHIAGATLLWLTALWLYLSLFSRFNPAALDSPVEFTLNEELGTEQEETVSASEGLPPSPIQRR